MAESNIEWCSHTENWLAGCSKVSGACTNCYAESMTGRLEAMPDSPARYHADVVRRDSAGHARWTGRVVFDHGALARAFMGLLSARKPRRVFANSMSDTFHPDAPPESLLALADTIRAVDGLGVGSKGHVLMLLTKRPEHAVTWQRAHFPSGLPSWVWVGCTVEDQAAADERIPHLLDVDARIRFLSMEPLLGPVDLFAVRWPTGSLDALRGVAFGPDGAPELGDHPPSLGWVIAGCESHGGPKRAGPRATLNAWLLGVERQCREAGVPFFLKQRGVLDGPVDSTGYLEHDDGFKRLHREVPS